MLIFDRGPIRASYPIDEGATFANVRVTPPLAGIHTAVIYLDSRANGNDRSTKRHHEAVAISGCTLDEGFSIDGSGPSGQYTERPADHLGFVRTTGFWRSASEE